MSERTLLHLVPFDEAPASSSMLWAVCVLCCCVHDWQQQLAEHCGTGVQIDMFEVGLDFQKELGEVFGYLLADRVLEGAHVRPVQRLSVSREVPLDVAQFDVRPRVAHDFSKFRSNVLWRTAEKQEPGCELGVTSAPLHVRVDRVDHVQECLLRDPVRRGVGHELERERWPVRVHSVALLLLDDLCLHAAPRVRSERDRDEGARGEDTGWLSFFLSTHVRLMEPCAQPSRPGSRCDPVRFWSDRTGRWRAAARVCFVWQCQPHSACGGCKSPQASMIAASSEETAASIVCWARIRCRARAAHGGRRAAKWWRWDWACPRRHVWGSRDAKKRMVANPRAVAICGMCRVPRTRPKSSGTRWCERGDFGQGARLLSWRSASGILPRWRPHGGRGSAQGSGWRRKDRRNTRRGTKWRTESQGTDNRTTWMTMQMRWRAPTHSLAMQCDVQQLVRVHCMRKSDVWGALFTPHVGYSRSPSAVSENYCNKKWIELMSSTSFWTCPSSARNHQRKTNATFGIDKKEKVLHVLLMILGGDGSWLWLHLGSLIEVASVHSCPISLMWDTIVFDLWNSSLDGRSDSPVPTYPFRMHFCSVQPLFELRITIYLVS